MNTYDSDKVKQKRWADIEKRAIALLKLYAKKKIERDAFGEAMSKLQCEFIQTMKNEKGEPTFDRFTPVWLNGFLAFEFIDWNKARQIHNAARENPQLTSSPDWPQLEELVAERDRRFMLAVKKELRWLKQQKGLWAVLEKLKNFIGKHRR